MIKKIFFIFLVSILTACMPPKVISKKDVNIAASESRKDVVELKNKNPMDVSDLAKVDQTTLSTIEELRNIVKIHEATIKTLQEEKQSLEAQVADLLNPKPKPRKPRS